VGQVPVALVEVEAVADEVLVGDGEADVAHRQVLDEPAVRTVEERRGRERARPPQPERPEEVVERQAGVDDVVDQEHVAAGDVAVEILQQPDAPLAARVGTAVAGELDEVDAVGDRDCAAEVGEEDEARLQQADEDRFAADVVGRDLTAELADARRDLLRRQVDGTDSLVQLYDARSRWYRSARRSMSRL
jgi:hypothetical protein